MEKPCILVVEDERAQREVLQYNLISEGYEVVLARDGNEAIVLLDEIQPNLILLAWMLPGVSGIEICRRMKSRSGSALIPVIMISARSDEIDLVRGLETGADDYVTKPFSMKELMARVRTQLRKSHPLSSGKKFEHKGLVLDGETYLVTREGTKIDLGPTEFRLLAALIERPSRVWSRDQLLDRIWGRDMDVETRTVDVHIGRLRKALCAVHPDDPIRTVRGTGYSLA